MPKPPASLNKASEPAGAAKAVASEYEAGDLDWIDSSELEETPKELTISS